MIHLFRAISAMSKARRFNIQFSTKSSYYTAGEIIAHLDSLLMAFVVSFDNPGTITTYRKYYVRVVEVTKQIPMVAILECIEEGLARTEQIKRFFFILFKQQGLFYLCNRRARVINVFNFTLSRTEIIRAQAMRGRL